MDGEQLGIIGIAAGVFGLLVAFFLYNKVNSIKIENETVAKITGRIYDGAMAFLWAEYKLLSGFIVVVAIALLLGGEENGLGLETMVAFIIGAICSVAAGFSGMRSATSANGRTAQAAADGGQSAALTTSYNGGAVMGLAVGGLGLAGISLMYYFAQTGFLSVEENIAGFGMGASSIALFARVGGGIYTKAADVGADLVGKVEAGIPEDDPRNPGVIADNVGDNVGDVAGMGADIFESFVGSIIAAMVIAAASKDLLGPDYVMIPIVLAVVGYIASIIGVFSITAMQNMDPGAALRNTTFIAAGLFIVGGYFALDFLELPTKVIQAVAIGSLVGILIGLVTEYYTGIEDVFFFKVQAIPYIGEASKTARPTQSLD